MTESVGIGDETQPNVTRIGPFRPEEWAYGPIDVSRRRGLSRIRWYGVYGLLAVVNATVIALTLHIYSGTVRSADQLVDATHDLEAQARWLHLVQQRVLELSAPASDLPGAQDVGEQRRRFELARKN